MIQLAEQKRNRDLPSLWQKEKRNRELRFVAPNQAINTLLFLAARKYNISLSQLVCGGNRRFKELVHAREVVVYVLRQVLLLSQPRVAELMGYVAPSSVLIAERRVTPEQIYEGTQLWAQAQEMANDGQAMC